VLRLVFAGDDRPRKGLRTLLAAYERIGRGPHADRFHLDIAGPSERHVAGLANTRVTTHGWLQPDALATLFRAGDVIVAPASADRPEDGEGDTGMVDGFPSTSVRSAMATGCLLVGSNPDGDDRLVAPGRDYVSVPERDPEALESALVGLLEDRPSWAAIAGRGALQVRALCDVRAVVDLKLRAMGL
jgi:glycosyltransferase involved in cell wall biosynthesis